MSEQIIVTKKSTIKNAATTSLILSLVDTSGFLNCLMASVITEAINEPIIKQNNIANSEQETITNISKYSMITS